MGVLKLTIQQFFRINGSSTQRRGVTPDIGFPDSLKHLKTGERNLDNSLPWSEVDQLEFVPWISKGWDKADLLKKSQARQSKSVYFISLEKRSLLLKKRQDESRVPLRRKDYETRLKAQRDEIDALIPDVDKQPDYFMVTPVRYAAQKPEVARGGTRVAKDKAKAWSESLAKDAVVDETVQILGNMITK